MTTQEIMDHIVEIIPTKIHSISSTKSIDYKFKLSSKEVRVVFANKDEKHECLSAEIFQGWDDQEYSYDFLFKEILKKYEAMDEQFKIKKDDN